MTPPIGKAQGESNCVRATVGGKEACERMGKRPVCHSPRGCVPAKSARLRTETSYEAGPTGRVSQTSRSRSQSVVQVKGALARRKFMSLSGEICQTACEPSFAPTSKACLKDWNGPVRIGSGKAEVSRGRSTVPRNPIEAGRAEQGRTRKSHLATCREGTPARQELRIVRAP